MVVARINFPFPFLTLPERMLCNG